MDWERDIWSRRRQDQESGRCDHVCNNKGVNYGISEFLKTRKTPTEYFARAAGSPGPGLLVTNEEWRLKKL